MNSDCTRFRERLADALRGPRRAANEQPLGGLAWHAHVIHCGACRELLAEEEALEELLRSLPQPHLPRALAERVLSRLDGARTAAQAGGDLDRLLELTPAEPPPINLAGRVLARVHAEQELDRLLENLPRPGVPVGLEKRVLARLQLARRGPARVASRAAAPVSRTSYALRIAAGFAVFSLAGWALWSAMSSEVAPTNLPPIASGPQPAAPVMPDEPRVEPPGLSQPDEQLLASLEIIEAWDLLDGSEGLDAALATLDSFDEYLLEFEAAAAGNEATPVDEDPAAPTKPASAQDEVRQG